MAKMITIGHAVTKAHLNCMVHALRDTGDLTEEQEHGEGHTIKFDYKGKPVFRAIIHSNKKVYLVRALEGMIELS